MKLVTRKLKTSVGNLFQTLTTSTTFLFCQTKMWLTEWEEYKKILKESTMKKKKNLTPCSENMYCRATSISFFLVMLCNNTEHLIFSHFGLYNNLSTWKQGSFPLINVLYGIENITSQ